MMKTIGLSLTCAVACWRLSDRGTLANLHAMPPAHSRCHPVGTCTAECPAGAISHLFTCRRLLHLMLLVLRQITAHLQ